MIFILCELNIEKVKRHFNFLRFFIGKGFFCLFLGFICFDRHKWFSWACSILFFASAVLYIILGIVFLKDEQGKFNSLKDGNTSTSNQPDMVRDVNVQQNAKKV